MKLRLIAGLFSVLSIVVSSCGSEPTETIDDFESLNVVSDSRLVAGEPASFEVTGTTEGEQVLFVLTTGTADLRHDVIASEDSTTVTFDLPEPSAGEIRVTVFASDKAKSDTFEVLPSTVVTPVELYTGQRTVVVGAVQDAMAVAIPVDVYGNVVVDSDVSFELQRPSGERIAVTSNTSPLVFWTVVGSQDIAGKTFIATQASGAVSGSDTIVEVPATPAEVLLLPPELPLPLADGFTLFTLETDTLVDRFSNTVLDGQLSTLKVVGPTGEAQFLRPVISGQASFTLPAPELPGSYEYSLVVDGVASEPLALEFETAVDSYPATYSARNDSVEIGPVSYTSGELVADGTKVEIELSSGEFITGQLVQGVGTIESFARPVAVRVLGAEGVIASE